MGDFEEKTVRSDFMNVRPRPKNNGSLLVTVFDAKNAPRTIRLNSFQKEHVVFGRSDTDDIQLSSKYVSRSHGRFSFRAGQWVIEDRALFGDRPSVNGMFYNNEIISSRVICDGDLIRIDDGKETISDGVLFVVESDSSDNRWTSYALNGKNKMVIGRDSSCDIVLPHVSVSKRHAIIVKEGDVFYIIDNNSTNGVIVNNRRLFGKQRLHEKDVIVITNSKIIFTSTMIHCCCLKSGISVDAANVVIQRGKGKKAFITGNNVSLNIKPGELVAIIGGSGAGKSTILNCMCGYLPPTKGDIYINGINLYDNFDSLKKMIGYVPQSDIVYDNLTVEDMLRYAAKLRLPKDTSKAEYEKAVSRAIEVVELTEKRGSYIKSLSGGQKKRASIAVELLSDPKLLFLDEPASGLDPGTERNLMTSLREMADGGKTVILVTHSTLQLKMCDKIVFMGKGGKLCFFGSFDEALDFFHVDDIVDVYRLITDESEQWRNRYNATRRVLNPYKAGKEGTAAARSTRTKNKVRTKAQLPVLISRYFKLIFNDRQRLLLLFGLAPLLAFIISLVADGNQFEQYDMTKSLLFSLSCGAFFVGITNSIQEICKERTILRREYMTGVSLTSYIVSKVVVLSVVCLIQSILMSGVFCALVGLPDDGVVMGPYFEMLLTTFLTELAAMAMGLFVSALFNNPDRANAIAPLLLLPQLLFSGLIFKTEGATNVISWFIVCRWSMEGYGSTSNLNDLPTKLQLQGLPIERTVEKAFEATSSHMTSTILLLLAFLLVFGILARIAVNSISKEKS